MATDPEASPATRLAADTRTDGQHGLLDLTRTAVEDLVRLIQQEIQLAKVEVKEMLTSSVKGGAMLAAAGVCGLFFLILALVTIALVFPPHALIAGIEAALFLVAAIVLGLVGKSRLKIGPPEKTMTSLKEDAEWARQLLKRSAK